MKLSNYIVFKKKKEIQFLIFREFYIYGFNSETMEIK